MGSEPIVDLASLARRARTSGHGEAYTVLAKGPGYRLGVGARVSGGREPTFFVEVVLDPFPDRPRIDPSRLRAQALLGERLRTQGYDVSCDDSGMMTYEGALEATDPERALDEVEALLAGLAPKEPRLRRS